MIFFILTARFGFCLEVTAVITAVGSVNDGIFSVGTYFIPLISLGIPVWDVVTVRRDRSSVGIDRSAA